MTQVVIHKQPSGRLAVFHPAPEALAAIGIHALAERVVPKGRPFKIIDASDLPEDHSMRDAWTVDDADLTDGVGAA